MGFQNYLDAMTGCYNNILKKGDDVFRSGVYVFCLENRTRGINSHDGLIINKSDIERLVDMGFGDHDESRAGKIKIMTDYPPIIKEYKHGQLHERQLNLSDLEQLLEGKFVLHSSCREDY